VIVDQRHVIFLDLLLISLKHEFESLQPVTESLRFVEAVEPPLHLILIECSKQQLKLLVYKGQFNRMQLLLCHLFSESVHTTKNLTQFNKIGLVGFLF